VVKQSGTLDLRLAIPALVTWLAVAIVIDTDAPWVVAVVAWALAGAGLLIAMRTRWSWVIVASLAAVLAAVGLTAVAVQAPGRHPALVVDAAAAGQRVTVVGITTQTALPGRGSFALDVTTATAKGVSYSGSIPMLVFGEGATDRLGIGTTVILSGTITATDLSDETSYLFFSESAPTVLAPPPWYLEWANELRQRFLSEATSLPGDGGDLLAGLAIGDTTAVSETLDSAMKSTSLSHLTAVSGANCAVVIALIMLAGAAIGLPRGIRIVASLVVLVGFVVLVTPEPSVLRAAVMAALVLASLLGGRPVRGIPVLAVATVTLLVIDPWLARSYGFVLSVLATGGLLLMASPLARVMGRWMPRWLALGIAVPLAAQLACQPVILLLNASLPTYGVLANMLAEPAAPVATVLGLAACVLLAVAPPLGSLVCQLAWVPAAWIAAVASFFSGLPAAQLPWPAGVAGVLLLTVLTTLALGALFWRGRGRAALVIALAIGVVGYGGIAGGSQAAIVLTRPADWQIAVCDIGQGDAVVVRSAGQIALIDTGPKPERLTRCLTELGISRIDLLVLTHYDLDHVGGTAAVIGRVDRVLVGPSGDAGDDRLRADLESGGAAVEQVSRGPSGLLGELRWSILWPPARLIGIEPGNPASVTLEFDAVGRCDDGCLSSIFLGDLGERAQQMLLAANALEPVDVVKVAHHGSADQSETLYQRLRAIVGVIGVGADNGYGHPTQSLLEILTRAGTQSERTDRSGMILLAPGTAPHTVRVWTER